MIKKLINIIFCLLMVFVCYSQQLPHYSLYMYNNTIINPAFCGSVDDKSLTVAYRNQWTGFPGAPKTQLLSYEQNQSEKISLGGSIFSDETGPISRTGGSFIYSYKLPVTSNYNVSLGLSAGFYEYVFDDNEMDLYDNVYDPAAPGIIEKDQVFDASFGIYLHNNKSHFGISIPNLIEEKININTPDGNSLIRHYFIYYGYSYEYNDITFRPSLMLKKTASTPMQYDISIQTDYSDDIWIGCSYRDQDALVFMFGVNKDNYSIGYSYDKIISDISYHASASHGVVLKYRFSDKKDTKIKIESYKDTDKDGVIDKLDNCPNTPGTNNGCPVFTKEEKSIIDTALVNLEFQFNNPNISSSSYPYLEKLAFMLSQNKDINLVISGHTDNIGADDFNLNLSKQRAENVMLFLVNRGLDVRRVRLEYHGEDKPIASNQNYTGRSKNRRVEFNLYFK